MNKSKTLLTVFFMNIFLMSVCFADTTQQQKLAQQKKLQQQKIKKQKKSKQQKKSKATSVQQTGVITNKQKSKFEKFNEKVGKALSIKEGGKADRLLRGGKFIEKLTINEKGELAKIFRAKKITRKSTTSKKRYNELSERKKLEFRNRLTPDEQSFIDNLIDDGTINSIDELFVENNKIGKFFRAESLYSTDSLVYELNSAESFLLAEEYLNKNPKLKRR